MRQTGYLPLQTIAKAGGSYVGGICRWWYTPIESIDYFPAIDPVTQMLATEPTLKAGKDWYGPVRIADKALGWSEDPAETKAGFFYKQKVEGFIPGNEVNNHINLGNLAFHQLCIVAKLRSGGFYIVLGNDLAGLRLIASTSSGIGAMDQPGKKIVISGDTVDSAPVLPAFTLDVEQTGTIILDNLVDFDGADIVDEDGAQILFG